MRRFVLCLALTTACEKDKPTVPPDGATPAEPVADAPAEPAAEEPKEPEEPKDPRADHTRECEEEGKATTCTALAVMWERGREGPQDEAKARGYYDKGCSGGHQLACFNLGSMFAEGRGGDADPAKAFEHFASSCEADPAEYKDACLSAGITVDAGATGVKMDRARARELYGVACDNGELVGCRRFAQLMILGVGGEMDAKQGRAVLDKACEAGEFGSCFALGQAYRKGLGGKKNKKKAKELIKKACDGGFKEAC